MPSKRGTQGTRYLKGDPMTDKEAKEALLDEMKLDMIYFYGHGAKLSEEYGPLCDHLSRAGWRKVT